MVFLTWGTKSVNLNEARMMCPSCRRESIIVLLLKYSYAGFYWIFHFVYKRSVLLVCSDCGQSKELDKSDLSPSITSKPIPFFDQYGLGMVVVSIFLTVSIMGMLA